MSDSNQNLIPLYRVLILSVPEDPADLTTILTEELDLNKVDARILQHNLPGLIPNAVPQELAEKLCQRLHDVEGYAIRIAADEIPNLSKPIHLHHAACADEGFEIFDLQGNIETTIPYGDLELLSIGALPTEKSHREVENQTLVHPSAGPRTTKVDLPSMMGAEAYLIAENPFRVYLINQNEMNYAYLEDRKTTSATANFRLFVDDILAQARDLYLTPAARAFTNHGLLNHYQFDSPESLRRHTLFHLLICRQMHQQ
ncbi:MAG: hypothetical protein HUJ26_08935 [Planctomycetaceae bacterium]|nr:hypothetical protein [Planctomycetaceae bacterium]